MEFQKFSSLENSYRQNLIDKVMYEGKDSGLWIATEKLDGANGSFWCDGEGVKFASRTQFVDGTFFNCQAVINRYSQGILDWCVGKFGVVTNKDFGKILGLTVQDILDEFTKETDVDPKKAAEDNWKQFNKLLSAEVGKTVRSEFVKRLD